MRSFYTPIMVLALLAMVFLAPVKAASRAACSNKNPYVANAIDGFCSRSNIVVPSSYAGNGHFNARRNAYAKIQGGCSPPQWVPRKYCYSQFYQLCAAGDRYGSNTGRFGRNGCQNWQVEASGNPKIPKKKPKKSLGGKL